MPHGGRVRLFWEGRCSVDLYAATKYGFGLHQPRLPASTLGRHSSIERYWQSQCMSPSPPEVTAHQGASYALAGCRRKTTGARTMTAATIIRSIFNLIGAWSFFGDRD